MVIETLFEPGDKVHIDGCTNLTAVITAVQWRCTARIAYEVSWIANGEAKCPMIEEWRLSGANK